MKAIINGKIITEKEVLKNMAIIFDKEIVAIIDEDELINYSNSNSSKGISSLAEGESYNHRPCQYEELEIIDAKGQYVGPGFIDIHIHGSGGKDTMDGDLEALKVISKTIAKNGVTGFLPTTMTMDKEHIYNAFKVIRIAMESKLEGAAVLGCHMEGPFINKKYKGAQNPEHIIAPDFQFIKDYVDIIKIITIAPEKDENHNFLSKMKNHKEIVLSMGHSNATFEEAMESIKMGISHSTHVFNAMTPLNHREPGVVGAVFKSNITCELIADTVHVHPGIYEVLNKVKGTDKLVLITDSMRAGCMKEGIYDLGGQEVLVKEGSARLNDGTLAGSILTLNEAVKNFYKHSNIEIYEAVNMAALNPARVIGLDKYKGSLEVGKHSDIIIFDEGFQVNKTIVGGQVLQFEEA
ncbi:N-acetylglucosamine-6-phosphate deacetylase [Clostridium punense]|uniref:N-acetylglucosamine-6-phosphate deacetylase n=1 Tax=Clostridium punense TaxID=1054297 RepID=A0ABS4K689_9CLOT|nr:N-acetylglucosamine-6-phosphate deacetylase [Clostridium punense]MBP2023297.1 N-acetylglucosamine-6-phosphate deacetylase [Clostridium punense]